MRSLNLFVAFLVILMLLISGCTKLGKPSKDNLVIGIEKAPMSLDPRYAVDTFSFRICRLLYGGLVRLSDSFEYVPHLAKSYSMPDDKTYVFELRKDVFFHDGTKFTSKDVKYTYETIMDPEYGSVFRNAFQEVESISAPDDYSLIIKLKRPFAPFMTAVSLGIIPKHIGEKLKKEFSKNPIGTGVFKLKKNMERDGVILERNDAHFLWKAKIKNVTFKPVLEGQIRVLELLKGSIDMLVNSVPAELSSKVEEHKDTRVEYAPSVQYKYLGFNMEDSILKNIKVREAIAYAIDRDSLIKYKLSNHALKATGFLAPMNWAYTDKVKKYDFDPKKAKKLLDEAGYLLKDTKEGKYRFNLNYKTSTDPEALELAHVIAENLKDVGINVSVRSLEFGVFFDDIKKGNYHLYTLSWTDVTEPDHFYYIFNSKSIPPDGGNRGRYRNMRMDLLTELGRVTLDKEKRKKIYYEIQELAALELPYVSLWHRDNSLAVKSNVKGFKLRANGDYYYLKDTYKE